MSQADDIDPDRSLQEWMAYALRNLRKSAGMTQKDVARSVVISESEIKHLEAGRRPFREHHAKLFDELFHTDDLFVRLWTHSQREHDREWFRRFTAFERRSDVIRIYQPLIVPGLFQTPAYARALLEAGRTPNIDDYVAARMARQEVLYRERPPDVWLVITETALREPVGGPEVHRDQLAHLLKLAKLPHVTVQVVRAGVGAHVGLDGGFILLTIDRQEVAFTEAQLSGRLVRDEGEVRELTVRYDRIRAVALSRQESLSLIEHIMEARP